MLHEIKVGVVTQTEARRLREEGGYAVPAALFVDALSVHAAVTATHIKIPAEKSLLSHIRFLRECLDNRVLAAIIWLDTRDMQADGLTKGSVDRAALDEIMAGHTSYKHSNKIWQPKILSAEKKITPLQ